MFDQPNTYRGPPAASGEEAWESLWNRTYRHSITSFLLLTEADAFIDVNEEAFYRLDMTDPRRYQRASNGGFHVLIDENDYIHSCPIFHFLIRILLTNNI